MSQTTIGEANAVVAANVRAELARSQLQQKDLAPLLCISPAQVSQRMTGRVPFTVGEAVIVADFMGIPIGRLLNGVQSAAVPA